MQARLLRFIVLIPLGIALAAVVAIFCVSLTTSAVSASDTTDQAWPRGADFDAQWRDGKAEIAAYDLTYPRYGELREGTAVAIFVTEPFLWEPRVKADRPNPASFDAVKLNLIEDFTTGVYDYNLMTSVFVTLDSREGLAAGTPVKSTFTSQEWCGHVFEQAVFGSDQTRSEVRSYFEMEADQDLTLDGQERFVAEDALLLWAHRLAGPSVEPGGSVTLPLYRSAAINRLLHVDPAWDRVTLRREAKTQQVDSALGDGTEVEILTAEIDRAGGGQGRLPSTTTYTFQVEKESPHRVIRWSRSDGYAGELVGVERMPYWMMQANGEESELKKIGLAPRGALMP